MSSIRSSQPTELEARPSSSFLSAPANAPSPAPSNSSTGKRKRDNADKGMAYSQPAITGTGFEATTQIVYAVEHLKEKDRPLSFDDFLSYLSMQNASERDRKGLRYLLQHHSRILYNPKGLDRKGSYEYKPAHPVKSADDLKGYLQKRTNALGVPVKELKDGWKNADKGIAELERNHEILVTHFKKDNAAKTVWQNDPTLVHPVDETYHRLWHAARLPANPEELRAKLEEANLKPASAPKPAAVAKPKDKKRKTTRRGGKQTNDHMKHILRDYSDKRA